MASGSVSVSARLVLAMGHLGLLGAGDQLPTVKDVAGSLAINPITVLKAYRLLEYEGLVAAKPGVGTFRDQDG